MAKKSFSSIDDLANYIKNSCYKDIIEEVKTDGIKTMKEVTEDQVEGITGDVIECIGVIEESNSSVTMGWQDNGGWYSLAAKTKGDHMYAPWALEHGKVWDFSAGSTPENPIYKEATTLEETSTEIIEKDTEITYKKIMRQKGFNIK